jgi:hypothetical protein
MLSKMKAYRENQMCSEVLMAMNLCILAWSYASYAFYQTTRRHIPDVTSLRLVSVVRILV